MASPPVLLCITIFRINGQNSGFLHQFLHFKSVKETSHYLQVVAVHFPGSDKHFQFGTPTGKNGTGSVSIHHIRMRGFQKKAF